VLNAGFGRDDLAESKRDVDGVDVVEDVDSGKGGGGGVLRPVLSLARKLATAEGSSPPAHDILNLFKSPTSRSFAFMTAYYCNS